LNLAVIALKEIVQIETLLARSNLKARLAVPGLDPKRVDTLLPTAVVFRTLLELLQKDEIILCDKAIREGVIYDFIQRHREGIQAEHDTPDVRKRNVLALARRCHSSETHALHVARLALRLFDQTKPLHGYGQREREWLEFAAILHDIGYLINPRQHHKHAYYLIKHSDLSGLTAEEVDIVANIARYHRRALPGKKHDDFAAMPVNAQRIVRVLGALLRVADALDRSQFSVVQNLHVTLGKNVTILLHIAGEAELEIWAARGRADLFEKVFHRSVQFEVIDREEGAA
jgi:exopolyphosphatase/guanosine-5'-triphosphate,3'-diphosphate pyrophosphatase